MKRMPHPKPVELARLPFPRGILFDMGDTLLTNVALDFNAGRARVLEIAHNPRGVTAHDYAEVSEQSDLQEIWTRRDASLVEIPWTSFDRLIFERLGLTFDIPIEEVQNEFWRAGLKTEPEPGVYEMLECVQALNIPLAVLSNSSFSGRALCLQLERHDLLKPFKFVMSSSDYAVRKPHPALFLTAAAKLGMDAGDIGFIGDTFEVDVIGASQAGMIPIWYNRKGASPTAQVDHTSVRTWKEFENFVRQGLRRR